MKIQGLIDNIRNTIRYLDRTPSGLRNFEIAKQHCRVQNVREMAMDVPTRWNSTFTILETALPLRNVLDRLSLIDSHYDFCPTTREWDCAAIVLDCLRIFFEATKHFSGSNYPTSNVFFPDKCNIHLKLIEWEYSEVAFVREM